MSWRIELTPRAFAEIAASGVGRDILKAIRELEAGPNQVDLARTSATSRFWTLFPAGRPASDWQIVLWFDEEGESIIWIYSARKTKKR